MIGKRDRDERSSENELVKKRRHNEPPVYSLETEFRNDMGRLAVIYDRTHKVVSKAWNALLPFQQEVELLRENAYDLKTSSDVLTLEEFKEKLLVLLNRADALNTQVCSEVHALSPYVYLLMRTSFDFDPLTHDGSGETDFDRAIHDLAIHMRGCYHSCHAARTYGRKSIFLANAMNKYRRVASRKKWFESSDVMMVTLDLFIHNTCAPFYLAIEKCRGYLRNSAVWMTANRDKLKLPKVSVQ